MIDFKFERVNFVPDPAAWKHFTQSRDGVVGSDLRRRGRRLALMAKSSVGKDTGQLAASIEMKFFPGPEPFVTVGSENSKAYLVHEGTRPHELTADPGRVLRFKIRGRVVYAREVKHPGTPAQKYLSRHLRKVLND